MESNTKFEVGETYQVRSLGDWDCIFSFEVTKRAFTTVWLTDGHDTYQRRISVWDGVETCKPYGTYSLSPTLRADRKEA